MPEEVTLSEVGKMLEDLRRLRIALATSTCDGRKVLDMLSPAIDFLARFEQEPCRVCEMEPSEKIFAYGMQFKKIKVHYCPNCARGLLNNVPCPIQRDPDTGTRKE